MSRGGAYDFVKFMARGRIPIEIESLTFAEHYEEALADYSPLIMDFSESAIAADSSSVSLPADFVSMVDCYWDGIRLYPATLRQAEAAYGRSWRHRISSPRVYIMEAEESRTLRLFPAATASGTFRIVYRAAKIETPPFAEIVMGLQTLSKEFAYDSPRRDEALAGAYAAMAQLFGSMVQ